MVALVAALFAVAASQAVSAPPLPPPGRLIDVGGWRLLQLEQPEVVVQAVQRVIGETPAHEKHLWEW